MAWLSDPNLALMSIVIANVWRGTAFSMILQYAGLQSIPDELYEAAEVDGAGALQSFWYITIPQLRPILMINIILITISTLNTFDMILPLTGGGPGQATEVLALHTYNVIFREYSLAEWRRARRDHAGHQPDPHPRLQEVAAIRGGAVRSRKTQRRIGDALTYLVFALALVFFGGPLLWVLSLSIRTPQEVYITSLRLIPESPTLENYVEVLILGAVLGVPAQLAQALRGGERRRDAGRRPRSLRVLPPGLPRQQHAADRRARPADDLPARESSYRCTGTSPA